MVRFSKNIGLYIFNLKEEGHNILKLFREEDYDSTINFF